MTDDARSGEAIRDARAHDAATHDAVTDALPVYDVTTDQSWTADADAQDLRATDEATDPDVVRDWAWVEEWREGGEPVPWGPGLTLSGFTLILVASAVYVLSSGLAGRPIVAIAVNLLVAAGLGPALWLSRSLPVLRWIAGGAVAGVLSAWLCVFVFLV